MSRSVCPVCAKPLTDPGTEAAAAPFCSERCRLIDLGRWLSERYRISAPVPRDVVRQPSDSVDVADI